MLKYVVRHRSHSGRALGATHFAVGEGDSRVIRCRRITLRKFPPPYIWTLLVPESSPTLPNSGCLAEVLQHWIQLERVKPMQLTSAVVISGDLPWQSETANGWRKVVGPPFGWSC